MSGTEVPEEARWAIRLDAALGEPGAVAALGARAARLLDAVANARAATTDSARPSVEGPSAGGPSALDTPPAGASPDTAPTGAPRFGTLADCVAAAPAERAAEAALLTFDALGGAPSAPRVLDRALGTACRLYPARLLLFVDAAEAPPAETLFAFGFRRLVAGADGMLHEYRLRDYKMPPDWLNARFWANPTRFDADPDDGAELGPAEDDDDDEDGDEDDEEE